MQRLRIQTDFAQSGVFSFGRASKQAERGGFEPPNEVDPRYAISSRARSTAPAPLRRRPVSLSRARWGCANWSSDSSSVSREAELEAA